MTPSTPDNEQNTPMPRKEDKLFEGSLPDWENNACIDMMHGGSYPYINGYLYAARLLVNEVTSTQRHQDTLVYPAIFLYRHYIELQLKDNLRRALYLTDTNFQPTYANTP